MSSDGGKRDIVLEALENAGEYFDQRADAEYFTDSPGPVGNEEMTRLTEIKEAIAAWHSRPREQALEVLLHRALKMIDHFSEPLDDDNSDRQEAEAFQQEAGRAINGGGNG